MPTGRKTPTQNISNLRGIYLCEFYIPYVSKGGSNLLLFSKYNYSGLAFCRQKPVSATQMAETGIKYFLPAETCRQIWQKLAKS